MNTTTTNTTTNKTLASIIKTLLSNYPEGVTVKEALTLTQTEAKESNLTVAINYRAVYQQLKAQGEKLTKGKFVAKQFCTEAAPQEVVAA